MATVTVKETIENARHRMDSAIESVRKEFTSLRAGRANASMLDTIKVDYYGTLTPVNQVGNIAIPDPSLITIQPWDAALLPVIEKAIRTAGLDLNPANDGKIIRIPIPSPTEERRKGLVKLAHKAAEEGKVAVRNVRRDANDHIKKMKKNSEISEDEEKQGEAEIQKLTDSLVSKIDEMLKKKEAEVLHVRPSLISPARSAPRRTRRDSGSTSAHAGRRSSRAMTSRPRRSRCGPAIWNCARSRCGAIAKSCRSRIPNIA